MKLENLRVVITGASKGLGKALAKQLLEKQADVIISDIHESELEKTGLELSATTCVADVTKIEDLQKLADSAVEEMGGIDMWINNAGIWLAPSSIADVDAKRMHDVYEVNVFGMLNGIKQALRIMKKQETGTILNIISTSALTGREGIVAYSSSKHAAKGVNDSLQEELKGGPIQVLAVYPGGMKTALFDEKRPDDYEEYMTPDQVAEKIIENLEKDVPEKELILKRPGQNLMR